MQVRPNFLIVGVAKCGTTALASILGTHPDCCVSDPKETCFFTSPEFENNHEAHLAWYQTCFAHYRGEACIGEATPAYANRREDDRTVKRIKGFNPDMKIIYMARDPLEKQLSAWKMYYYFGLNGHFVDGERARWALRGFEFWMRKLKEIGQWNTCLFQNQLEAYTSHFPPENIIVSILEDWRPDKRPEVSRIMQFLGLDPSKWNDEVKVNENMASKRRVDRGFVRRLRANPIGQKLIQWTPQGLKSLAREEITATRVAYDEDLMALSDATRLEFLEFVAADARQFLQAQGKPEDFWKSLNPAH